MTADSLLRHAVNIIERRGKGSPIYLPMWFDEYSLFIEDEFDGCSQEAIRYALKKAVEVNDAGRASDRIHELYREILLGLRDLAEQYDASKK